MSKWVSNFYTKEDYRKQRDEALNLLEELVRDYSSYYVFSSSDHVCHRSRALIDRMRTFVPRMPQCPVHGYTSATTNHDGTAVCTCDYWNQLEQREQKQEKEKMSKWTIEGWSEDKDGIAVHPRCHPTAAVTELYRTACEALDLLESCDDKSIPMGEWYRRRNALVDRHRKKKETCPECGRKTHCSTCGKPTP